MAKTHAKKKRTVVDIVQSDSYSHIYEGKTINSAGNIYVSTNKEDDLENCEAIVIVLPNKMKPRPPKSKGKGRNQ